MSAIGDVDGDAVVDLAVVSPRGLSEGIYILFMNDDGTVKNFHRIHRDQVGVPSGDAFGSSVTSLGDLDGDGIGDLAVGAGSDDTGGRNRGAVYVLYLNTDGNVKSSTKIAHELNGGPSLSNGDAFGSAVTGMGDLDGDGVTELFVGARGDSTQAPESGGGYTLFLNPNGTVETFQKIADDAFGAPILGEIERFGSAAAYLGDLNGDGVGDLVVGAQGANMTPPNLGAVYILFMKPDGTVDSFQEIKSDTNGGPSLGRSNGVGYSLASIGDLDGDGVTELVVGAQARRRRSGSGKVRFLSCS